MSAVDDDAFDEAAGALGEAAAGDGGADALGDAAAAVLHEGTRARGKGGGGV